MNADLVVPGRAALSRSQLADCLRYCHRPRSRPRPRSRSPRSPRCRRGELHPGAIGTPRASARQRFEFAEITRTRTRTHARSRIHARGASRMCPALILRQASRPISVPAAAFVRDSRLRANIRPVYPLATPSRESTVDAAVRLGLTRLSSCAGIALVFAQTIRITGQFGMHLMSAHFD